MLVSFSVENYKSFKEKQTIFMTPIKKYHSKELVDNIFDTGNKNEPQLLKIACIYGANATGKTKFINAISVFFSMIKNFGGLGQQILGYSTFAFDSNYSNKPTKFEIEFLLNNDYYKYSFSFNSQKIITEEFIKNKKTIYSIDTEKKIYDFKNFKGKYKNTLILMQNRGNINLFLNELVKSSEDKILNDIYLFFLNKLKIKNTDSMTNDISYSISIFNKNENREQIISFIKQANPFIEDIVNTFSFKYKNDGILSFKEESKGTMIMFGLSGAFVEFFRDGGIFFVDELDEALHPELLINIIRMFNNTEINKANAQLIFTAHNDILLDKVFNEKTNEYEKLFRRDQIYWTQKENTGETILTPLTNFVDVKKRDSIAKLYRNGYFGARNIIRN